MCRYRYYYFSKCRHHQTVLFDFCENAQPVILDGCASGGLATENACDKNMTGGAIMSTQESVTAGSNIDDLPSLCSTAMTCSSPQSSGSSFDTGLVSITAEPGFDCSSLYRAERNSHSSSISDTASHDMAGLPLWSGTFRNWMTGSMATAPKQSNVDSAGHVALSNTQSRDTLHKRETGSPDPRTRSRQPGIREHTDESCDLPKSTELLQHIAESCRQRRSHHVIDSQGSQDEMESTRDPYDTIEAEIDQLKEDVLRLREKSDKDRTVPKSEQELAVDRYLSTRAGRQSSPARGQVEESAAARLQRLHEGRMSGNALAAQIVEGAKAQLPPGPLDFPALSAVTSNSQTATPTGFADEHRRTSYADAATNGMQATGHAFPAVRVKRANSKLSESASNGSTPAGSTGVMSLQTSSTGTTQDRQEARDDESSVIIMSEAVSNDVANDDSIMVSRLKSTPNGKTAKQAPRFAQPTKSFSRRAGETLRKDSATVSPKSLIEGSPTKATKVKEPNFETAKRAAQHQQKRKSLPRDWMNGAGNQSGSEITAKTTKAVAADEKTESPSIITSPSSADGWQVVDGPHAKENIAVMRTKAKQEQTYSPLREKGSSYMAPTSATTQRTLATIGTSKTKPEPLYSKASNAQSDEARSNDNDFGSPRPGTAASDDSSVHFILDRPSIGTKHSPERNVNSSRCSRSTHLGSPVPNTGARSQKSSAHNSPRIKRQGQQQHQRSDSRASDSLASVHDVANTTTKRRTSHGHLLKPIVACLDAKGLLNKNETNNALVEAYLRETARETLSNALQSAREKLPETPRQQSGGSHETDSGVGARKILPPHLRKARKISNTSTSTDSTLCQAPAQFDAASEQMVYNAVLLSQGQHIPTQGNGLPLSVQSGLARAPPSSTPSLRATAKPFEPSKPLVLHEVPCDIQITTEWKPPEEWDRLPLEMRKKIMMLREMNNVKPGQYFGTLPAQRGSTDSLFMANRGSCLSGATRIEDITAPMAQFTGSPMSGVQVGQVLKPSLSPGKKSVQWMLHDVDGTESPINFGRAPSPMMSVPREPTTPTISATSDDTSPLKTPHSRARGWHIGSVFSPNSYNWVGGDGREIKFIGYGPHAERDPNSVVNFKYHGRTSSFAASIPNGFVEDKESRDPPEYVAPRSQRQWAEKLGYHKSPCGDVEVTHAVEQIPFGSQLAGYCHDCMAK